MGVEASRARIAASGLIAEAARLYDAPDSPFPRAARKAWLSGFASAAEWMDLALDVVRRERRSSGAPSNRRVRAARPVGALRLNALGFAKNGGSALAAAAIGGAIGLATHPSVGALGFVLAFYAIEGQMVFLFPIVLEGRHDGDGFASVFAACRAWTVRAGGTLAVMRVVMPISARMVFGGFLGNGFTRSWCLGCLAVVLWYDALRSGPGKSTTEVFEAPA